MVIITHNMTHAHTNMHYQLFSTNKNCFNFYCSVFIVGLAQDVRGSIVDYVCTVAVIRNSTPSYSMI